jgi:prolipoprotein diacylglyceryltransferase
MGHGRVFALYVAGYTVGRGWIEALRIDPANDVLGLRVNLWVSLLVFLAAVAYIVVSARLRPGREVVDRGDPGPGSGDDGSEQPSPEEPTDEEVRA